MNFKSSQAALEFYLLHKMDAQGGANTRRVIDHIQQKVSSGVRCDYDSHILAIVDLEKIIKTFPASHQWFLFDMGIGGKEYACEMACKRVKRGGKHQRMLTPLESEGLSPECFKALANVIERHFARRLKVAGYMGKEVKAA